MGQISGEKVPAAALTAMCWPFRHHRLLVRCIKADPNPQLADALPGPLSCNDVRKLPGGLVYLCNAGGPELQPFVAKLVPGAAYPTELHQAAAAAGLVPELIALVRRPH